jgi:hypothetical protein
MAFTLTSAKLTGNPGTSGWAQVHEFKPDEPEKLASRGHLFAVVATARHEEGVDSVIAGRELLARLHEEYFGKPEGEPFNILKSAVEKVIEEFKDSWGEVEIVAVAAVGDVVYSAAGGGAQVAIFRNGMLAKILESTEKEVVSASGYPKDKDLLLLASKSFFEVVADGVIKGALEGGDPASSMESLAPSIHARADTGNLGAVVVRFEKAEALFKEELPKEPKTVIPTKGGKILTRITQAASSSFEKAIEKVRSLIFKNLPERRIYVKKTSDEEGQPPGRKLTLSVGIMLLVILFVSIGFGIRQKAIKDEKSKYSARLTQAQHELDEALTLLALNPERARELFINSRTLAGGIVNEGVKDLALAELVQKLDDNQGAVLGEYKSEAQLFLDLSILSDGLSGDDMSGSSERAFILDRSGKKVVGIALATKKTGVVAGPDQLEGASLVSSYEDRVFILAGDGIYEVGKDRTRVIEKEWEGEVFPYAYAGNIYLLDKGQNTIWRYPGVEGGFSSQQKWLGAGVEPDFSNVVSITIDGSIWVLTKTGKILKFSLGSPQNISTAGIVPEISSADAIYTNEELSFVYILDRAGKRVVVLDKDGKYKAQYFSDKAQEAVDLVVSEKEREIILLTGDKLYSIELKHL